MSDQQSLFSEPPKRVFDFTPKPVQKVRPTPHVAGETFIAIVLGEIAMREGSDRQIGERLAAKGFTKSAESVRKRRKELEDKGYVRFSGEFVENHLGNQERIYEITYEGRCRAGLESEQAA